MVFDLSSPIRLRTLLPAIFIIAATIGTLYPIIGHDFVEWDDPTNLSRNPSFNPPTLASVLRFWRQPVDGLYVPLTYTIWAGLSLIAYDPSRAGETALDPRLFHAANLVIHVLCALAVFGLLRLLIRRDIAATVGALLFALHPVQVETVAWISGMKDLLGGLFSVVAIGLYLQHASVKPERKHAAMRPLTLYLLATLALVAALLSKPIAVIVPLIAAVLDWGILRRKPRSVVATLAPWVVLILPIAFVTRMAQPIPIVYEISPPHIRPIVAGDALAFHIRQMLFPAKLALDYGRSPDVVVQNPWTWTAWLVPVSIGIALFLVRRRIWPVVVGAMVFVIPLIPVLGFIPYGAQVYSSSTDHYLYLPLLGLALAVAWIVSVSPLRIALPIAGIVLLVLAVKSWHQTWHWQNTVTLFSQTLRVNPNSWTAHINLAAHALAENQSKLAEYHTREALKLRPHDGEIYKNLAIALGQQGRIDDAIVELRRATEMAPEDPAAPFLLAEALMHVGELDEAEHFYLESLRREPAKIEAKQGLARIEALRRDWR